MLIDTHAHLNFNAFKNDADEVIRRSLAENVWMINVGSQYSTSQRAVEMAQKYQEGVYAAIGLHPFHLAKGIFKTKVDVEEIEFETRDEGFDYEKYKQLALNETGGSKKVVAIGEIGLDYWYQPKTKTKLEEFKEKQKEVFIGQFELSQELNLPVILHCRAAHDELINIISSLKFRNLDAMGVIHCFTGTWEQAQKYIEMGFSIGLNGIIFKLNIDDIIKKIPFEKILLETDCPYLTPLPAAALVKAGAQPIRDEPIFVKYVAQKIAGLKNVSYDEIASIATENAKKLFSI